LIMTELPAILSVLLALNILTSLTFVYIKVSLK